MIQDIELRFVERMVPYNKDFAKVERVLQWRKLVRIPNGQDFGVHQGILVRLARRSADGGNMNLQEKLWNAPDVNTSLVERLRNSATNGDLCDEAADALEAQAGEIEQLKAHIAREHADHVEANLDAASVVQENRALQAEVLLLRKDAERYRWLRDIGTAKGVIDWNALEWEFHNLPAMDAAIDAAMEKPQPQPAGPEDMKVYAAIAANYYKEKPA